MKPIARQNVNADETTVYDYTSKSLDDQGLAADLSADLGLTVQWEGKTDLQHSVPLKPNK